LKLGQILTRNAEVSKISADFAKFQVSSTFLSELTWGIKFTILKFCVNEREILWYSLVTRHDMKPIV